MPPSPAADRNLLFGILALQMDFVRRDDLIAAMNAWVLDKGKPLGQILCETGHLAEDEHALLDALVRKHLQKHQDDPQQSLAALSSVGSVRQELKQIADPELQASLVHVSVARGEDLPDSTGPLREAGSATELRFHILRPHARGGLGEVFVARDEELNREVALKEIQQRHADQPESRARFLLEAEVTGGLEHPGIVPVYGLGTYADGRPFYAMRFIRGDSLKDAIAAYHKAAQQGRSASEQSLALRQLLGRFVDVCQAIAYAHSRGVLHRDLKPGNIMLGKYGETLVVDWGLAKVVGKAEPEATDGLLTPSGDSALTQAGRALGTPAYMSPEQAAGRLERLGPRSDVYSLGATLYCLLTGQTPFGEGDVGAFLARVQKGEFRPPREVNRGVAPALEAVCLKAMASQPEDRYATPREVAEDIEHWLADEPVSAYREPWTTRLGRWVRRRQTLAAAPAALLLTGVIALAVSTLLIGNAQQKTAAALGNEKQARKDEEDARKERALAQLSTLIEAAPGAVPTILSDLEANRKDVLPRLRERYAESHARRLALALLPVEPDTVRDQLAEWLLTVHEPADDPAEVLLVRDALTPHQTKLREPCWSQAEDAKAKPEERFRALVALAAFDPTGERWTQERAQEAVEGMLAANPLHLGTWVTALQLVREPLLKPLGQEFRTEKSAERRKFAATVLADYAGTKPEILADLLLDADPKQYAILFPVLQGYRDKAIERMRREVRGEGYWNDPPIDPNWKEPATEVRAEIEKADGLLAERWALCQTLPLERWTAVAEGLRVSGYRPVRLRPFAHGETVRVAAVWTRDGRTWTAETALTLDAVKERDTAQQQNGLIPADVASYGNGDGVRYAALWVKPARKGEAARLYIDVAAADHQAATDALKADGFIPWAVQGVPRGDGPARFAGVWWKAEAMPKGWNLAWNDDEDAQRGRVLLGEQLLLDVNVSPAPAPAAAERQRILLATADRNLAAQPENLNRLFGRAVARYNLRQDQGALADLDALIAKAPTAAGLYYYRAILQARTGRAVEARRDLAEFLKRSTDAVLKAVVGASVGVYLGEEEAALKALDAAVSAAPKDAALAYNAACVYALAAEWVVTRRFGRVAALAGAPEPFGLVLMAPPPGQRVDEYAERALVLLGQAFDSGYENRASLDTDPDLESLRGRPGFLALKRRLSGGVAFASVWHGDLTREAAESHGLSVGAHLERVRELAAQGYRPAALSVALVDGQTVTASAWQRPYPRQGPREQLARRQATGAATLLKLDAAEDAWPLFRHRPDLEARSQLVWRAKLLGVDAQQIVKRLEDEKDVSARRALILTLGEFTAAQLPADVSGPLVEKLLGWYRDDPDPGVHAAVDWLLRHGQEGPEKRPLDWGQAAKLKEIDDELKRRDPDSKRNWYVNQQGQTYVCVPGPVEFRMGSPLTETERRSNETAHRRRIPRSFALANRSVTVEEFQRFRKERRDIPMVTEVKTYSPAADCPILGLTWYEAAQYCNWLSEKEGLPETEWCYPQHTAIKEGMKPWPDYLRRKGYRLPTEAEWEYAARASMSASRYYGSSQELLQRHAWYLGNSVGGASAATEGEEVAAAINRSWPVGQKRPNALGLFDSLGNAWNWTQDVYDGDFPRQAGTNALVDKEDIRDIKELNIRVLRGGSFDVQAEVVRLAYRNLNRPSVRFYTIGLRPARTLP